MEGNREQESKKEFYTRLLGAVAVAPVFFILVGLLVWPLNSGAPVVWLPAIFGVAAFVIACGRAIKIRLKEARVKINSRVFQMHAIEIGGFLLIGWLFLALWDEIPFTSLVYFEVSIIAIGAMLDLALLETREFPLAVFIVAIHHEIQFYRGTENDAEKKAMGEFQVHLVNQCNRKRINLIAEECYEDLISINHALDTNPGVVSKQLSIDYLFCDPNPSERKALGIDESIVDNNKNKIRRKEWLKRLLMQNKGRILFVCGENEAPLFEEEILNAGHFAATVSLNWGQGWAGLA